MTCKCYKSKILLIVICIFFFFCLFHQELSVTDDTVLEEHNEDPALVQMRLIGDGGKIIFATIVFCF